MQPSGRFLARALGGAELGFTNGGKEQIVVGFTFTDAEGNPAPVVDQDGQPYDGISWFGYFSDKTAARTLEALRYCGWEGDDLTDLSGLDRSVVELVIEQETYEGKTRAKVQWVNKPGGAGRVKLDKPMDDGQRRLFAASMKALAASVGGGEKPAAPPPPAGKAPKQAARANGGQPLADDDIPF